MIDNPEFTRALESAKKIVSGLYDAEVRRFDRCAKRSFYLHRASGIGLIVLSASLPFLSGLQNEGVRTFLIPGVAFAISALSSLVTFMAFGDSWKGYRSSEIRTRYAYINWESKILEAQSAADATAGVKTVTDATKQFIEAMDGIAAAETQGFFQRVQQAQSALVTQKT